MKKVLLFSIVATTMLIATALQSAEVIPIWSKTWNQDIIHDFEFLRGEDEFIMIAGSGALGIARTLTGEIVRFSPLKRASLFNQIEITPDSNRCVITTGGDRVNSPTLELWDIEQLELIKSLNIKMDADSVDPVGQPYYFRFRDIVIDPIKPYLYAFITKTNHFNDEDADRTWLRVYNYETMEEIKDLTPKGFQYEQMKCMDISDDGRFLAVLNEGKSFLKIWDTEKFELITNKQLYDNSYNDPNDYLCEVSDIEFSHKYNDLIYISGGFPNKKKFENTEYNPFGLYKYSIINENFNKDYLGFNPHEEFTLFDDEERVLLGSGRFVVLNQKTNKQEIYIVSDLKYPTGVGNLYSNKYNLFLGRAESAVSGFSYDSQTSIESDYEEEIKISPNPTNNFVNIFLNCNQPSINYQINNSNGILISQNTFANEDNNLRLDFTPYPSGVYFITINCNLPKTYKIIKEG